MFRRHPVLSVLTVLYLGGVAWVTLGPEPYDADTSSVLWRFLDFFGRYEATDWITFDRVEFVANIAMFVPLGIFFVLLLGRRRWWLAILLCGAISCAIEIWQGALLPTRVADIADVVANTSGGTVGVLLGVVLMSISLARRGRRRRVRARAAQALG
ncbi:VanZ like family protein [Agreia bicolorata]|uniref:VanZ like family protein n=1 Tax=Agreia bicolorata TaxID=110935 RepID=A0A1T4X828_9MICO|nr:VanZ family protein [Agreia bicolorata]SKA85810.1 VanZ like family protein [Agreia bicolorata]